VAAFVAVITVRPRLGLVGLIVTGGLALGAAYALGVHNHRGDNTRQAEQLLLTLIVSDVQKTCDASADRPKHAVARVICHDPKSNIRATFTRFNSPDALKQAMEERKATTVAPPGSCFRQATAVGTYDLDDLHTGTLLCDSRGGRQEIAWTNDGLVVLGEAVQASQQAPPVMGWWSDHSAGLTVSALRRPFPDEFERRLLGDVPASFRRTCRRDSFTLAGSEATLKCSPGGVVDAVWYVKFHDGDALSSQVERVSKRWRKVTGSCGRHREEPAVTTYQSGTRICYVNDGVSWVQWSQEGDLIFAFAQRRRSNASALYRLFEWWSRGADNS
jgi:hypothetical protein